VVSMGVTTATSLTTLFSTNCNCSPACRSKRFDFNFCAVAIMADVPEIVLHNATLPLAKNTYPPKADPKTIVLKLLFCNCPAI
jgi:hypothetical protein